MKYSSCRFTLDIEKLHSQVSVPVSQGDTAKTFYISLKDGAEPYYITTGCTAVLSIVRPSGTFMQAFCTILDNTIVKYDFSENEDTAVEEGLHDCELTVYGPDGEQLSTAWFTMVVNARVVNSDDINITDEDRNIINAMILKEAARQEAEILRATEEAVRVAAEEDRQEAETLRDTGETTRQEAEEARVLAEEERVREFEKMTENGSLIPPVTSEDEGKFLRVEGGKWAAVEIPYAEGEEY